MLTRFLNYFLVCFLFFVFVSCRHSEVSRAQSQRGQQLGGAQGGQAVGASHAQQSRESGHGRHYPPDFQVPLSSKAKRKKKIKIGGKRKKEGKKKETKKERRKMKKKVTESTKEKQEI